MIRISYMMCSEETEEQVQDLIWIGGRGSLCKFRGEKEPIR